MSGEDPDRRPVDPSGRPLPPQVTMGLLNYLTAHSLDADYEYLARRRAESPDSAESPDPAERRPGPAGTGDGSGRRPEGTPRPRRPTRRRLLSVTAVAVFGLLLGVAAAESARDETVRQQSRESLLQQISGLRDELAATRAEGEALRADLEDQRREALLASGEGRTVSARLDQLRVAAGTVAVTGPGVRVVVDDSPPDAPSPQVVLDTDLQILVNGLWVAGAEAVSVNDQRLTNLSAIRVAGDAITVNYVSLRRPYEVLALGDPDTLAARFLDLDAGAWWLNLKAIYDLQFTMTTEESLVVPAASELTLRRAATRAP